MALLLANLRLHKLGHPRSPQNLKHQNSMYNMYSVGLAQVILHNVACC